MSETDHPKIWRPWYRLIQWSAFLVLLLLLLIGFVLGRFAAPMGQLAFCAFGVLTVLNEDQAAKRSYAGENHGESWGKTAVEMAVLRQEALGLAKKGTINLGFSDEESSKAMPKAGVGEKKVFF